MAVRIYNKDANKLEELKRKVPKSIPIQIKGKFDEEPIEFESKDDFLEYLADHFESLDKLTSITLNRMFKINGYRISRLTNKETGKQEISLRAEQKKGKVVNESASDMEKKLDYIISMLRELVPNNRINKDGHYEGYLI
jgi:hypothetical protein